MKHVVENVGSSIRDSHVDVNIVRRFFNADAWMCVQNLVQSCSNAPWKC